MKRILLLISVLALIINGFAQRPYVSKELRETKTLMVEPIADLPMNLSQYVLPATAPVFPPEEDNIGTTYYDLQTNSTMQNRIFVYDDGTIGSVFTYSGDAGFGDRGTGYNYYDGSEWGEPPDIRLESGRTGWPAYAAWGENGEINIAHYSGEPTTDGLAISRRTTKGTGEWVQLIYHSPVPDDADYVWPKMATGGINHSVVHLIALTRPIATTPPGTPYLGVDGALLYSRSEDGGDNWSIENVMLEPLNSDHYKNFSGDTYDIEAKGDLVAFLYGGEWIDFGLMKSTDGGETWTQTIIWQHPYPLYYQQEPEVTTGFHNVDGCYDLAFDQSGKVHVVFGINWAQYSLTPSAGFYWRAGVGGIGYWNEDRPTFSADTNSLCPYPEDLDYCTYTELEEDFSLIGWDQDVNENDTIDWIPDIDPALFYCGTSSQPQILIDEMNHIYVVFSSITEGYTNGTPAQTCRHIWCRTSPNGEWWGKFTDITLDFVHWVHDCVYPSVSPVTDDPDYFYLVYQYDNQPGNSLQGDPPTAVGLNTISVMKVFKPDVWTSVEENIVPIYETDVTQNYPNPFSGTSAVKVNIRQTTELSMEVVNMMGQTVYTVDAGVAKPGMNYLTIDGSKLTPGVYFYTVRAGETAVTKKMIVE